MEASNLIRDEILSSKEFLLKTNPLKLQNNDILEKLDEFEHVFNSLFQYINNNDADMNDQVRLLLVDSFAIWIQRSLQVIKGKHHVKEDYKSIVQNSLLTVDKGSIVFQYVIDFWTDGNAALVNALKDMFTKMLALLYLLFDKNHLDTLIKTEWIDKVRNIPSTLKVKYYMLEILSSYVDMNNLLDSDQDLIISSLSLMYSDSLSTQIGKGISKLLLNIFEFHYNSDLANLDAWMSIWVKPVLYYLDDAKFSKSIELYILIPLLKNSQKEMFYAFIKLLPDGKPHQLLSILKIGQELSIEEEPFHNEKLIKLQVLQDLLQIDDYKLSAFELLTFSSKKSKPVKPYIFDIIISNIGTFMVDNEIETRNYFCSAFKHFIIRLRDSSYALNRDLGKLKKANKFPEEQSQKLTEINKIYEFFEWVIKFIQFQLCPGSQYQRMNASFKILKSIIESGLDDSVPAKYTDNREKREYPFSISIFTQKSMLRLLIDNLCSNYNDIRQSARENLMIAFDSNRSDELLKLIDIEALYHKANSMLKRYQSSDMGASLYEFLYCISNDKISFINRLLLELENKIPNNDDEYISNVNFPISGYCTAIALILNNWEQSNQISSTESISDLVISKVLKIWNTVKEIVTHDASDGILPKKFELSGVSDQLIISYAFRSIKESSAMLDSLLKKFTLNRGQYTSIGNLLISQLINIRHSGAFQAVLPTFESCCSKCRKEIPDQLNNWLKQIILSIETKTQHITRRSGGLPFLITTILGSEIGKTRVDLDYAVQNLMRIATEEISEHQDKYDLPQINALNCIKAIFIESKLADACSPYISKALSLSLSNFTSDIWAIRNCSIMLFTSLQNRLFGKAGKSISARLFFTRHEHIREELLSTLRNSLNSTNSVDGKVENSNNLESVFLVISLLQRLKPTPGYNGLDEFKVEIYKCLSYSNWKIRDIAARTVGLLSDNQIEQCSILLESISLVDQNKCHGSLLAVRNILNSINKSNFKVQINQHLIESIVSCCSEIILKNNCFVTIKAYLEIIEILLGYSDIFNDVQYQYLISSIGNMFVSFNSSISIDGSKQLCLGKALQLLLNYEKEEVKLEVCQLGLLSPYFEVQLVAVTHILNSYDLSKNEYSILSGILLEMYHEGNLMPELAAKVILALQGTKDELPIKSLINLIETPNSEDLQLAAIEVIGGHLLIDTNIWNKVKKYCGDTYSENYRLAALRCSIKFFEKTKNPASGIQIFKMLSDDDIDIRTEASKYLNHSLFKLEGYKENKCPYVTSKDFAVKFGKSVQSSVTADLLLDELVDFVMQLTIVLKDSATETLFDVEKDNQYRNDIEQKLLFIGMLNSMDTNNLGIFSKTNELLEYCVGIFEELAITDSPLGWASNPDVFGRIIVLTRMVKVFSTENMEKLLNIFESFKIHDMVTELVNEGTCISSLYMV
ncbi:hypothetical protein Kpol_541p3 [Vanderwaltozyma polyspora DSM 70294]|uniref:Uncharacterized protein n=1 Tax=Vanderwaltozyma polyspora (strain ATCC 22028 / DSM 70294 / BCRC 21397 / CBS 2163 / NBRC 10782 / NRRL Y-8283 / UCD 57-17) TaxID=436907 RepID=A7TIU8_VANPO|nr:uncharacterized protein Kpol_541p3 [Vanderwaltozyma polyspora DSM 70294]EDO17760.1 hypothetical protein Kpol_541p3 [Vanderwaltozyma polyspora DSM 70294]